MKKIVLVAALGMTCLIKAPAYAGQYNGVDFATFEFYDTLTPAYADGKAEFSVGSPGAGSQSIVFSDSASGTDGEAAVHRHSFSAERTDWYWETNDPINDPAPSVQPAYAYPYGVGGSGSLGGNHSGFASMEAGVRLSTDRGDQAQGGINGAYIFGYQTFQLGGGFTHNNQPRVRGTFQTYQSITSNSIVDVIARIDQDANSFNTHANLSVNYGFGLELLNYQFD